MTEAVVLLPGIWCHRAFTTVLARRLQHCGYSTHSFGYRSVRRSPSENARALSAFVQGIEAPTVHYVGHSLGGLVILRMLEEIPPQRPGRILLLGTPLTGSKSARRLARHGWGRWLLGRSAQGGLLDSTLPSWPKNREVGMVAGSLGVGIGLVVGRMGEPSDGVVALSETRAEGLTSHRVVHVNHTGLLFSATVGQLACAFLRTGQFAPESEPARDAR